MARIKEDEALYERSLKGQEEISDLSSETFRPATMGLTWLSERMRSSLIWIRQRNDRLEPHPAFQQLCSRLIPASRG